MPGRLSSKRIQCWESVTALRTFARMASGGIRQVNSMTESPFTFAHFPGGIVQSHNPCAELRDDGLRHCERLTINGVESLGHIPCQF